MQIVENHIESSFHVLVKADEGVERQAIHFRLLQERAHLDQLQCPDYDLRQHFEHTECSADKEHHWQIALIDAEQYLTRGQRRCCVHHKTTHRNN